MRLKHCAAAALLAAAGLASIAQADQNNIGKVIITEILSNPAGNDDLEFIEIYNTTNDPIDISGWFLDDEDSTSGLPFPQGTTIGPKQALAVLGRVFQGVRPPHNDQHHQWTPERLETAFAAAYGAGNVASKFLVVDLNITIANTPTILNEVPFIVDADGTVVDVANYENAEHGWPAALSGDSIVLRPQFLNHIDNDRGCAWRLSSTDPVAIRPSEVIFIDPVTPSTTYRMSEPDTTMSPGVVNTVIPAASDCNNNGINDVDEICGSSATLVDCNSNLIPDSCETDLNLNGVPDVCETLNDPERSDRNMNGSLDTLEINTNGGVNGIGGTLDTNNDGIIDGAENFGKVIITEFVIDNNHFLTQASPVASSSLEWVEIKNISSGSVDVSGWRLVDKESGGDGYTLPIPAGTVLAPGEIAVLCQLPNFPVSAGGENYTAADAIALYQSLWGTTTPSGQPIRWIPLARWINRAFNATATIEILTLVGGAVVNDAIVPADQPTVSGPHPTRLADSAGNVWVTNPGYIMDMANYSNANSNSQPLNDWPGHDRHSTFMLLPTGQTAISNNSGTNWISSIVGLNGTWTSTDFTGNPAAPYGLVNTGEDFGSPGYLPTTRQLPTGEIIITEIAAATNSIYPGSNPAPTAPAVIAGGRDEFIEITNVSSQPIDLTGWYLQDEDGKTQPFPAGTVLQPNKSAIVIGVDIDAPTGTGQTLSDLTGRNFMEEFYTAWGCGYPVIQATDWYTDRGIFGIARLADNPNFINEIVRIVKPDGTPSDIANFDDDATPTAISVFPFGWPGDASTGVTTFWSIYVLPGAYTQFDNDFGTNWAASLATFDGAIASTIDTDVDSSNFPTGLFNKGMFGSPGYVEGVTGPLDTVNGVGCAVACHADFNVSGAVTVQDIFDFLAAWFAGTPAADFNTSGAVTVQDIFDFLAAWFAGC